MHVHSHTHTHIHAHTPFSHRWFSLFFKFLYCTVITVLVDSTIFYFPLVCWQCSSFSHFLFTSLFLARLSDIFVCFMLKLCGLCCLCVRAFVCVLVCVIVLVWRLLASVYIWVSCLYMGLCVCVWPPVHCIFSGCVLLTLSVWSVCSLMEVARAKCRAPSCCLRHPRWHALCPSPCPTLKSSARPLTADSAHPHLRVSHPQLPLPSTNPITAPVSPQTIEASPNQF